MRQTIILIIMFVASIYTATTTAKEQKKVTKEWKYDIECAGTGSEGTFMVKVWSYGKKANIPAEEAKKNAVHGVLFKGFAGAQGCTAQKAIVKDPATQNDKADFFDKFFDKENTYLKYASIISTTPEIIKVGKNEYKVGYVISISKDQLRKDLEAAGIIRSLSSGF